MLADRIQRIGFSPTLKISAKAKAMRAEGIDVVDLSVGEPDFPTPQNVKEAATRAIAENFTKYTANDGMPELKKAIIEKLRRDNGLEYEPNEIIVSSGAKNCLYNLAVALLNKGEEVIIPAPYWVSYPPIVSLAKGNPIVIQTREENGFRLTPDQLSASISPSTKAIMLNNPCNPTGAAYTREELEEMAEVCADEGLIIIADEIYEKLVYDGFSFVSVASLGKKIKERCVIVNGVSKAYSMTGWRIGYAAGPKELITGMDKVQSHNTSNACSVSQKASLEALTGPQTDVSMMVMEFQRRRNVILQKLNAIPGISCMEPRGAFYVFPNFRNYFNKEYEGMQIRNSYGMAYFLLKHARVAVVPGEAFGTEGYIRLSYATSMDRIEEGLDRIIEATAKLEPTRKAKVITLNNTVTLRKSFVETEATVGAEVRDALVTEAEAHLTHDNYFEWNVNISGVVVQLRTNLQHLYDFWIENWYPAQLEADLEPHGIIYAVGWVPGREPRAYYNSESRTAVFFKSAFYGQLRSLAIGMTADISERLSDLHCLRGFCVDFGGSGLILIAPKGTGKSEHLAEFLRTKEVKLVSNDVVFVRYVGGQALADTPERKFYQRTDFTKFYPDFATLFDRSKCENVIFNRDECTNSSCPIQDDCRLDRGNPFCYEASDKSYAMLDPYWIGGPAKHAKRTSLKWVFLLTRDAVAPPIAKLGSNDAIKILEEGRSETSTGGIRNEPFFNPHLLVRTSERIDHQKRFFDRLFKVASVYAINTTALSARDIQTRMRHIISGNEAEGLR
ncbi:MAG: pyridoxal phosphate-dependent aminotransferase [Gemmatimonadota bacterium]|nr:MAG: pyridoxal phosphate-dependent aminotransferase [Gemmatimonadota bacterium]